MARKPSWILKAPRVVLVLLFPIINFILYLLLSLGCVNNGLSTISPILLTSTAPLTVGGIQSRIDIRIGFWGLCFGPPPYACATSISVLPSAATPASLARTIPARNGGANPQLLSLALALQSTLIVLSGILPLILLFLSLLTNFISLYFNVLGPVSAHAQASVFARAFDWGAAAAVVVSFATYRSLVDNVEGLLRVATGTGIVIRGGSVAGGMFGAVVGLAVAGAVINTVLTAGDAGRDAAKARVLDEEGENLTSLEVGESRLGGEGGKFQRDMQRRRAAYSVMYT